MVKIKTIKTTQTPQQVFVGKAYSPAEQDNEALAHLWQQSLEHEGIDRWTKENPPIISGLIGLYDKAHDKAYIGTLHEADAQAREGFNYLPLPASDSLTLEIAGNHKTGELADQKIFNELFQQAVKEKNIAADYRFAYFIYDNVAFDPTADENHLAAVFLLA